MAEQKAQSDASDTSVSAKERVEAARRTDKQARDLFDMSGDDIEKADW